MSPQFLVADLNRSILFYTQKLGFENSFVYRDFYAGIINQGYSIHLKLCKDFIQQSRNQDDPVIVFSITGIKELYKQLQSSEVEIVRPLGDMPYAREFYIKDPDGYILAFIEEVM